MGCVGQVGIVLGYCVMVVVLGLIHPALSWVYAIGAPLYYLWNAGAKRRELHAAQQAQRQFEEAQRRQAAEDIAQAAAYRSARDTEARLREAMAAAQAATAAAAAAQAAADAMRAAQAAQSTREAQQGADRQAQQKQRPQPAQHSSAQSAASTEPRWRSSDPYVILDVPRSASRATIRAAYAELSKQYHPDRVASLGQEFRDLAEARMRAINAAYEKLRDAHGP